MRWPGVLVFGVAVACAGASVDERAGLVAGATGVLAQTGADAEWVEFAAGAGVARVRFEMTERALRAEGEVVNRSDGPIWWRGPGIGCQGSGTVVAAQDAAGERLEGGGWMNLIACTMEDNEPVGKVLRARWRLDPGEARAFSFVVVAGRKPRGGAPMHAVNEIEFEGVELDRLHEVAVYEEFCLARDTPPERTMEFEQRSLLLGWSRMRGGVAYLLDDDEESWLGHYDPFAEDRVFRGGQNIPFAVGPLAGRVDLIQVAEGVRVDWELIHEGSDAVSFGLDPQEGRTWHLSRDQQRDRWAKDLASPFGREADPHPSFAGEFPTRGAWSPGERRAGSFVVPGVDLDRAHQWSAQIPVDWPRVDGRAVPTSWCVYWHGRYGADTGVASPFRAEGPWIPFNGRWPPWVEMGTASFDLDGHTAVVRRIGATDVALDLIYQGEAPLYAMPRAHLLDGFASQARVWLQRPGEEAREPVFPEMTGEPRELAPTEADSRFRIEPGQLQRIEFSTREDELRLPFLLDYADLADDHPWSYLVPISLPTREPPQHTRDFPLGWLEVRFVPGEGLTASLR